MTIQPFIIVPTLIRQPTWGGDWIVTHKGLDSQIIKDKIGQSFELFEQSLLTQRASTTYRPEVFLADPEQPTAGEIVSGQKDLTFSIQELVDQDPTQVIGTKLASEGKISTLIKLNQAKGNSYQLHVKEPTQRWLPKPESWYYLEPGVVTLGAKKDIDWQEFESTCQQIENKARDLSSKIQQGLISTDQAKAEIKNFIQDHNPQDFVNLVQVGKHQGVDLSACGIHHSWEEDETVAPLGNVVYEVQVNVYDPDCTIRVFDKGKFKEDGSVRETHVADYFQYVDRSIEANNPQMHFTKDKVLEKTSTYTVREIFSTQYYSLSSIALNQLVSNKFTSTTLETFHHLFAQEGNFELMAGDKSFIVTQGFSIFIPASTGQYQLKPYKTTHSVILKTSV